MAEQNHFPAQATVITYRVPYADTDQMGVVYYANYYVYFERCRNEVLRQSTYSYLEIERSGVMLPVIESHCDYKSPAYYDDMLEIAGWFEPLSATRLKASCVVMREGKLLARGHTIHICMRSDTKRPIRIPEKLSQLFNSAID